MTRLPIKARLEAGDVLIMDGGMGTELNRRGADVWRGYEGSLSDDSLQRNDVESVGAAYQSSSDPAEMRRIHEQTLRVLGPWSAPANLEAPETVTAIHTDYLHAGADILLTNNFFTSQSKLARLGAEAEANWEDYARAGAALAVAARDAVNPDAYVFGAMAPPADGDLKVELGSEARVLAEQGVDAIIAEYLGAIDECVAAVEACSGTGLPVFVGVRHVRSDGRMQYLERFENLAAALEPLNVAGVLLMCSPPEDISAALPVLRRAFAGPIGAYSHSPEGVENDDDSDISDERLNQFSAAAAQWVADGAQIVGGCCGTRPEHIAALTDLLGRQPVTAA